MKQLKVNIDGLSPALVNDLKKAIAETIYKNKQEISDDLILNWPLIDDSVNGKIKMNDWFNAAHAEHIRFCKEYPR